MSGRVSCLRQSSSRSPTAKDRIRPTRLGEGESRIPWHLPVLGVHRLHRLQWGTSVEETLTPRDQHYTAKPRRPHRSTLLSRIFMQIPHRAWDRALMDMVHLVLPPEPLATSRDTPTARPAKMAPPTFSLLCRDFRAILVQLAAPVFTKHTPTSHLETHLRRSHPAHPSHRTASKLRTPPTLHA